MTHHANDGSASRALRGLLATHGYNTGTALGPLLARMAAQQARCIQGEHDERVAEQRRVTYVAGRQVRPGARYCHFCSAILEVPTAPSNEANQPPR